MKQGSNKQFHKSKELKKAQQVMLFKGTDQRPAWKPEEVQLDDDRILVLEST